MYDYTERDEQPDTPVHQREEIQRPNDEDAEIEEHRGVGGDQPDGGDNHPLDHRHLATFQAVRARARPLVDLDAFKACMTQKNSAVKCNVQR